MNSVSELGISLAHIFLHDNTEEIGKGTEDSQILVLEIVLQLSSMDTCFVFGNFKKLSTVTILLQNHRKTTNQKKSEQTNVNNNKRRHKNKRKLNTEKM